MERKVPCSKEAVGPVDSMVLLGGMKCTRSWLHLSFLFVNITILSTTLTGIAAIHNLFVIIIPVLKMCPSDSEWLSQDHSAVTSENQV